jgi:AraC family transcriptional regulator
MQLQEPGPGGLVSPTELVGGCGLRRPIELIKHFPGEPFAASDRLRWVGLEALRYRDQPPNEAFQPPLTHHSLLLFLGTPKEFEALSDGIRRVVPPPAGSILMVPAGSSAWWRWSEHSDSLHVFLEPGLVARVTAEAFELDPGRVSLPPLDGLQLPQLRAAMLAVNDELTADAAGGRLAAESLANLLAVHLIRNASAARPPAGRAYGALPRGKLRAAVEYIDAHLDAGPTLEQMAAAVHLSAYHFARRFKAATGLPPHQYVIARRVDRAKQLLQDGGDLSLAAIGLRVGFSDQSQFSHHFKCLVGVTPGQFRRRARIA